MRRWRFKLLLLCIFSFIFLLLFFANKHQDNFTCKWPPKRPVSIPFKGTFDLTICVRSNGEVSKQPPPKYSLTKLFRIPKTEKKELVTFDDLANLPAEMWKKAKYPEIYWTYPQDVPLKSIVKRIKRGETVDHMPNYNFPIGVLKSSKSICSGNKKHDLIIVIKSAVLGWQARESFRTFMRIETQRHPDFKVGCVFSVGLPREKGGRLFNRDGHRFILKGSAGDLMEANVGKNEQVISNLSREIEQYDDILLGNYEDTYFNLTWKTVTNLRWISAFCDKKRHHNFMLIDDDHRVNLSMVIDFLKNTPQSAKRRSIFGYIVTTEEAGRDPTKKWFISRRELPWNKVHPFPNGFSQFIGADVVDDLAIGSAYTKHNYFPEDLYLGIMALKLNIPLRNEASMYSHYVYEYANPEKRPAMVAWQQYFKINSEKQGKEMK